MLRADVAVTIIHTSTEAISAIYPTEGRLTVPRCADSDGEHCSHLTVYI